ncbi:hypothetical protein ELOC111193_15515 [Elizabethkingia occulta]
MYYEELIKDLKYYLIFEPFKIYGLKPVIWLFLLNIYELLLTASY